MFGAIVMTESHTVSMLRKVQILFSDSQKIKAHVVPRVLYDNKVYITCAAR